MATQAQIDSLKQYGFGVDSNGNVTGFSSSSMPLLQGKNITVDQLQEISSKYALGPIDVALRNLYQATANNMPIQDFLASQGNVAAQQETQYYTGKTGSSPIQDQIAASNLNQISPTNQIPNPGSSSLPFAPQTLGNITGDNNIAFPTTYLQPGQTGDDVKKLQDYLVNIGYMTQDQVNTGYGIYGPKTTAAVTKLQQDLGVDNSTGPGFFGPRTITALQGKQSSPISAGTNAPGQIPSNTTGYDTGNPELNGILAELQKSLDKTLSAGQVVNPNIELNPAQIQGFLDQASREISPYYASQINSIKDDLSKNIQNLQKQYDIQKQSSEAQFKQNLAGQRESAAGAGLTFSGVRGQQEEALQGSQQRSLDLSALGLENQIGNTLRTTEGQIGSNNLNFNLPQFTSSNVSLEGAGGYNTGRTLSFGTTGGIYGTLPGQQLTDIQKRKNELETAAREGRTLDFYS